MSHGTLSLYAMGTATCAAESDVIPANAVLHCTSAGLVQALARGTCPSEHLDKLWRQTPPVPDYCWHASEENSTTNESLVGAYGSSHGTPHIQTESCLLAQNLRASRAFPAAAGHLQRSSCLVQPPTSHLLSTSTGPTSGTTLCAAHPSSLSIAQPRIDHHYLTSTEKTASIHQLAHSPCVLHMHA